MNLLCPRLTSATSSHRLSTTVASRQSCRPPRVMRNDRPAYVRHIYAHELRCKYWTLSLFALLSLVFASYVISVRRTSVLPAASSRFHLTVDTLAVQLTVPPAGAVRDFHPQVSAPCRAHESKRRWACKGPPSFHYELNLSFRIGL